MKINRLHLLLAVPICLGPAMSSRSAMAQKMATSASSEQVTQILAGGDRSAADRINDQRRHPQQMLEFIGINPGIVAVDLSAAGGYTTELLARSIGPSGRVYGQSRPRNADQPPSTPAASEGNSHPNISSAAPPPGGPRPSPVALADREQRLRAAGITAAPIVPVIRPFEDPIPPELATEDVDLVTLMFNYHDLGYMGVDRMAMNRAVFRALKPGGLYVIADHAGRHGTGISESGTLHRIEEAFLRQEVEAAGFRLLAEGDFLRNPNDPKDKNTPDPPQPKDEFVLKFVRP
jgi:predicted methyltransferase